MCEKSVQCCVGDYKGRPLLDANGPILHFLQTYVGL